LHGSLLHSVLQHGKNTDISQGSVARCLRCEGTVTNDFIANLLVSVSERILKIGQHLTKLRATV